VAGQRGGVTTYTGKGKVADQKKRRIVYVKPQAVDLGSVAPVIGASCRTGTKPASSEPECTTGNVAKNCHVGHSAFGECGAGSVGRGS
jgi:hypothetical protein